jgi:hypothetical protein
MTFVRTWSGWAYVAFVLDVYSRMIVGWQVANHMRTELPLDALEMALWRRRIKKDSGLIHHSDRGSQYVSIRYTDRLADIGASASVGSVADSYDNAMAEALNGTFKAELIEMQGPWTGFDHVERAIFQWVTWYNEERLHSALDYVPPAEYERDFWRSQEQAPRSQPEPIKIGLYETRGSSLLWRLPWLACLLLMLTVLVAVFGRAERRRRPPDVDAARHAARTRRGTAAHLVLTYAGLAMVLAGLLGITTAGRTEHSPAGLPIWALLACLLGAVVLRNVVPRWPR